MPSSRIPSSGTIGVVGLGYVGLPLSLTFCEAGRTTDHLAVPWQGHPRAFTEPE